jgi:hypothetical protein
VFLVCFDTAAILSTMEERDQERRFLTSRIEELERLDANIKGSISKEKTQYNVSIVFVHPFFCTRLITLRHWIVLE